MPPRPARALDKETPECERYRERRPDAWRSVAQRSVGDKIVWFGLKGMVSKDGFTWEELPDPLVIDHTDTLNVGWYDQRTKKYVIFVRTWNTFPRASSDTSPAWFSWLNHARRCIGRIEGDDFRNLPLPETILEAGPDLPPHGRPLHQLFYVDPEGARVPADVPGRLRCEQ